MIVNIESCLKGAKKAEGIVVVIDVFRASNTVMACLDSGAEYLVPVDDLEEAYRMKKENPDHLLYGERDGVPPIKFDSGNSPVAALNSDLKGKKIIFTTSGGCKGIVNAVNADQVLVGSFANAEAIVKYIKSKNPEKVTLVPIGSSGTDPALEDEECAKYIKKRLFGESVDFNEIKMKILASSRADELVRRGQGEDLKLALKLNIFNIIPECDKEMGRLVNCIAREMNFQPLTTNEMKAFEQYVCDHFEVSLDKMMVYAGWSIVDLITKEIIETSNKKANDPFRVLVVSGKGNNGGDALVSAFLLHEARVDVTVLCPYPDKTLTSMAQEKMQEVREAGISVSYEVSSLEGEIFDLIVDGLFGFSLKGNPNPPTDSIINWMNKTDFPILAVDVPSGLEAETGQVMKPTVKASHTLTLGMLKIGLDRHKDYVGKLFLGSLGIPERAYRELGYYSPIFLGKSYISLD